MKISSKTFTHITLACITCALIAQSVIGWQWLRAQANHDAALNAKIVQQSQALLVQTEQALQATLTCKDNDCLASQADMTTFVTGLKQVITQFQSIASQQKSNIRVMNNPSYPLLLVAINRFNATNDISPFQQALLASLSDGRLTHQNLIHLINAQYRHTQQQLFVQAVAVFIILGAIMGLLFWLGKKGSKVARHNTRGSQNDIEQLATQLERIDAKGIKSLLNDLHTSPVERRIYANLSAIYQDVEFQKRHSDLYRQLYALIGYEIRGMTNTIQGGVRLLAQDADENGAVMARDITLATNTLSELADNYNRLISAGNNAPTGNVSFLPLVSDLVVHLTAKTQHTHRRFDCHLSDNLPEVIEGNSTSLFWVLFLQLSNAISAQKEGHILLNICTQAADEVEQTRLIFEAIFLPTDRLDLAVINGANWQAVEEKSGTNDEWSRAILSNVNRFKSNWSQAQLTVALADSTLDSEHSSQTHAPQPACILQKLHVEIDITPKSYHHIERTLEKKNVMICTDSPLQIDLMSRMLTQYGATVQIVRAANDIFRALPNMKAFDAIIITDTVKGIKLKSFCKTLHSRLKKAGKTKLFLAASDSTTVKDTHQYVNKVFYTPFIPHELIPSLTEAIQEAEEADIPTQSAFLIVEDDRVQQFLLKKLLSKQGYDAHTVSDGSQAVQYMKEHGADIVFMDCIMPGMGGIEATKLIRQREIEQDTHQPATIIGATALTSASEHKLCIEAGMDYVISKPYKNDEIIKVIKKYMAIKKSVKAINTVLCGFLFACVSVASGTLSPPALAADLLNVVDAALAHNLTLRSTEAGLRASQYDLDVNRAKFLPSLGIPANTRWNDGATQKEQSDDVHNRYNDHGVNITLSQTLFNLGDLYSQGNVHIALDIESLKTEQIRQKIIREASISYFEYLKIGAQIRATQAEFDSSVSRLTLINRNIELGNVAGTERYEVLAQKERNANTLRTLKKDRLILLTQLENIVQQPVVPDFDLQSSIQFKAIEADKQRVLNDILYRSGNDLLIAQQTVHQRRQKLKETAATFSPSVKGSIGYTYNNTNEASANFFPDNGTTEEAVYTLTVELPIVDGGRDFYRYQQNKVNITQSEIALEDSRQRNQQQFDEFIYNINDLSASLQSLTTIIQANYASYLGIQKAHKLGTRTITDLLSAESKLFSSIRDYERARYDYIITLVQLNEIMGNLNINTIGKIAEKMSPMSDKNTDSPIPLHVLTQ